MGKNPAFKGTVSTQLGGILGKLQTRPGKELCEGLEALLQDRPKVAEALLARMAHRVIEGEDSQRAIRDPYGEESAYVYLSPYALPSAGAAAFVTATDMNTGEMFVLLGKKTKQKKGETPYSYLVPPGGYMEVKPPKGTHERHRQPFDINLEATTQRETFEEADLDLTQYHVTPTPISACSTWGKTDPRDRHSIFESYHYNLLLPSDPAKTLEERLPRVRGKDDLAEGVYWINVKDIQVQPDVGEQEFKSRKSRYTASIRDKEGNSSACNIMDCYGSALAEAIARARTEYLEKLRHPEHAENTPDPAVAPLLPSSQVSFAQEVERLRNTQMELSN